MKKLAMIVALYCASFCFQALATPWSSDVHTLKVYAITEKCTYSYNSEEEEGKLVKDINITTFYVFVRCEGDDIVDMKVVRTWKDGGTKTYSYWGGESYAFGATPDGNGAGIARISDFTFLARFKDGMPLTGKGASVGNSVSHEGGAYYEVCNHVLRLQKSIAKKATDFFVDDAESYSAQITDFIESLGFEEDAD